MNIKTFDLELEDKIRARGLDYYENGAVEELEVIHGNKYYATVRGSEQYAVEIALDTAGNITYQHCNCPYDWGDVCKHEAAVLYLIRAYQRSGKAIPAGKLQSIKSQLQLQDEHELRKMIFDLATTSPNLKRAIMTALDIDFEEEDSYEEDYW